MGSLTKGYIGKEDMSVQTNTSASETFNRTSSTGGTTTLTKVPDIWAGTGKIEVAECETDTLSNDTGLSVKIGGTEAIVINVSGETINITGTSYATSNALTLYNKSAASIYGPSILWKNDNFGFEDYQCRINAASLGYFVFQVTRDAWGTTVSPLTFDGRSFKITGDLTAGDPYIEIAQTHASSDGNIAGMMRQWIFQDDDMADDATVALPTGVQGICTANAYGNAIHAVGMWSVLTDGTVLLIAGTQYDDADTDGSLCLYDDGTGAVLKQRLGGAAKVRVIFNYY